MHLVILLLAILTAWGLRQIPLGQTSLTWSKTLICFVFPPLLLLMTALALVSMGYDGQMLGLEMGGFTYLAYGLAVTFLGASFSFLFYRFYQAQRSRSLLHQGHQLDIAGKSATVLALAFPYSAQIGFWRSQLVVSQGLMELLDEEHLASVLAHEQAHDNYRDTFWFFWLGWLRTITAWLPQTQELWQELLFLRELRADQKAVETVDPLVLAESLMIVAQSHHQSPHLGGLEMICAAFQSENRLLARINGLLEPETQPCLTQTAWTKWFWLMAFLPLLLIPFHY
jgi:Zn-dependent protease with chaperone function